MRRGFSSPFIDAAHGSAAGPAAVDEQMRCGSLSSSFSLRRSIGRPSSSWEPTRIMRPRDIISSSAEPRDSSTIAAGVCSCHSIHGDIHPRARFFLFQFDGSFKFEMDSRLVGSKSDRGLKRSGEKREWHEISRIRVGRKNASAVPAAVGESGCAVQASCCTMMARSG